MGDLPLDLPHWQAYRRGDPCPRKALPMARPTDRRPALTFRGDEFTPEWRATMSKAAKKMGKTQTAFIAEAAYQQALNVLKGEAEETAPLPAVLAPRREEFDHWLAEALAKASEENERRITEATAELRDQVAETNRLVAEMGLFTAAKPWGMLGRLLGKRG